MTCWLLFWNFARIAICTLGGGSATIPYLMELPQQYDWVTTEQLAGIIAVGESAPGPGGINMASCIGYEAAGIPGVLCAVAGLCLPSMILVTILAACLQDVQKHWMVQRFFYGLRPAVTAVIAVAVLHLMRLMLLENGAICVRAVLIYGLGMVVTQHIKLKKLPLLVWIAVAGVAGILFRL